MTSVRRLLKTAVAAATLLAPVVAAAQWFPAFGPYIGAGGGRADNRDVGSNFPGPFVKLDQTQASWKGYVGFAFGRFFAVQAGYQDFGTDTVSTPIGSETVRNRGYDVNGLLGIPLTARFMVFLEGGASRFQTQTVSLVSTTTTHQGTHPDYGAGVQYEIFRHMAVRGQWQEFRIPNNNTEVYSGSLLFRF